MRPDGDRGGFIVENPVSRKRKRFKPGEERQARQTAEVLAQWVEVYRQKKLLDHGKPTLIHVIDRMIKEQVPHQPWDVSTRQTAIQRCNRIKRELGYDRFGEERLMQEIDSLELSRWLSKTAARADPFNKWRLILVLIWGFAAQEKLVASNEAEKVMPRSTSRKIPSNRKTRRQLIVQDFTDIHDQADPLLQLAMELSLVTLQARKECCNVKHTDIRDGFLFIIRDKVAADSDMAFIKIRLTAQLEDLQARARKLDNLASPFLLHRRPERMQRRWIANKPHWTYVNEDYITRLFDEARNRVPRFAAMPARERPTFHEIRGLGSRLMKARGIAKDSIRALMTHSNAKTTEIYLELGAQALTDEHYTTVSAPFSISELLGA